MLGVPGPAPVCEVVPVNNCIRWRKKPPALAQEVFEDAAVAGRRQEGQVEGRLHADLEDGGEGDGAQGRDLQAPSRVGKVVL